MPADPAGPQRPLRVLSRRSDLARAQARQVTAGLGVPVDLVALATTGDLHPERAIAAFDTKGLFVDTIRRSLLEGAGDVAVHSCKDLPTDPVEGLVIAAVPLRANPADVLVTRSGLGLADLPRGATVGTSSARRRVQVHARRPDLDIREVRGNVPTRLGRVAQGALDAVVLAAAGLDRLTAEGATLPTGLGITALSTEECLPCPAQGALALECRAEDAATRALLAAVQDPASRAAVDAERALLAAVEGGCSTPVGALAHVGAEFALEGMLVDGAGTPVRRRASGSDPVELGRALGRTLVAATAGAGGGSADAHSGRPPVQPLLQPRPPQDRPAPPDPPSGARR